MYARSLKQFESEQDEKKLTAAENKEALLHPEHIKEISQYILKNFRQKTHRLYGGNKGKLQRNVCRKQCRCGKALLRIA